MSASDKLLSARLKLERAHEHFGDLNEAILAFEATNPCKVGAEYNRERACHVYVMTQVNDVPDNIRIITGDLLHNLRCALDHLAMQIWIDGGSRGNQKAVMFPIAGSASDYTGECTRKIPGARPGLVQAIEAIEPYHGGRGHKLWMLHHLDIIDKHRLLIMAASAFWEIDLTASFHHVLKEQFGAQDADLSGNRHIIGPSRDPSWRSPFPLKAGDKLVGDFPGAPLNNQVSFGFDIAFAEPQIAYGDSIINTSEQLIHMVNDIIDQIGQLLS